MSALRIFSLVISLLFLLSACTKNPIDQLESNIQSGSIDQMPDLATQDTNIPDQNLNFDSKEDISINLPQPNPTMPSAPKSPPPLGTPPPATTAPKLTYQKNITQATISTSKGDIMFEFFPQEAPNSTRNFASKALSGFYNGLTFHRVEDWVIQGGDPQGDGTGGGDMPTELSSTPFSPGSVGIARGGDINISNDSQFFICTADCSWLTGQYTLIGQVTTGLDIAQQIQIGDQILAVSVQ